MKWVKLKPGNDWGVDYWAFSPLNEYGTASRSRGINVVEGDTLQVRWPDGTVTLAEIATKTERRTVPDMGRSYDISFESPRIKTHVNGVEVLVALHDVEVDEEWARKKGAQ